MVLAVRQEDQDLPIQSLDDLIRLSAQRQLPVGMQQDLYYGEEFDEMISKPEFAKHFESVADAILNPRKLRAGRIVGFFEEELSLRYRIKTDRAFKGLAIHPFALYQEDVFFGVSKALEKHIIKKLRTAYNKLEVSGELDRIRKKDWW